MGGRTPGGPVSKTHFSMENDRKSKKRGSKSKMKPFFSNFYHFPSDFVFFGFFRFRWKMIENRDQKNRTLVKWYPPLFLRFSMENDRKIAFFFLTYLFWSGNHWSRDLLRDFSDTRGRSSHFSAQDFETSKIPH